MQSHFNVDGSKGKPVTKQVFHKTITHFQMEQVRQNCSTL